MSQQKCVFNMSCNVSFHRFYTYLHNSSERYSLNWLMLMNHRNATVYTVYVPINLSLCVFSLWSSDTLISMRLMWAGVRRVSAPNITDHISSTRIVSVLISCAQSWQPSTGINVQRCAIFFTGIYRKLFKYVPLLQGDACKTNQKLFWYHEKRIFTNSNSGGDSASPQTWKNTVSLKPLVCF